LSSRLVGEHARDVHKKDLGLAFAFDRLLAQRADARLELDVDERATLEEERGEYGEDEQSHGRSISCGRRSPL